jgi:hypothetical protein
MNVALAVYLKGGSLEMEDWSEDSFELFIASRFVAKDIGGGYRVWDEPHGYEFVESGNCFRAFDRQKIPHEKPLQNPPKSIISSSCCSKSDQLCPPTGPKI